MLPTTSFRTSSPIRLTTPPVSQPVHTEIETPLPTQETASTLHSLSGRKRKAFDQDQNLPGLINVKKTSAPKIEPLCESSGSTPMPATPKDRIAEIIRTAAPDGDQLGTKIMELGMTLGGRSMTAENRDALLAEILCMQTSIGKTMCEAIAGLAEALGGRTITPENRDALITQILGAHGTRRDQQMGALMDGIGRSLGGRDIIIVNLTATVMKIVASAATCSPKQMGSMILGLGRSLGGQTMTEQHRDALLNPILAVLSTRAHAGGMIQGLGLALGGPAMKAEHRQAMTTRIIEACATGNDEQTRLIVTEFGLALGGPAMTTESCGVLMKQILDAPISHKANWLFALFNCLGGRTIAEGNLQVFMATLLGAHATLGDRLTNYIAGNLFRVLGKSLSAERRRVVIAQLAGAPASCSGALIQELMVRFGTVIEAKSLSTEDKNAMMTQILGVHTSSGAARMQVLIEFLGAVIRPDALLPAILGTGASPIKTGMMTGAAMRARFLSSERQEQYRRVLDELRSQNETARLLKPFIDAGCFAASGDLSEIMTIDGLTDGEKLNFVSYSCSSLKPLDQTSLPIQLGKILFLDVPGSLKAQTLALLLNQGPGCPALFKTVRHWLIGTLADRPKITWKRTESGVEIDGDTSAFAEWYASITTLYHEFRKHMTPEFIAKEKTIISRHPLLPEDVKEKILGMLSIAGPGLE